MTSSHTAATSPTIKPTSEIQVGDHIVFHGRIVVYKVLSIANKLMANKITIRDVDDVNETYSTFEFNFERLELGFVISQPPLFRREQSVWVPSEEGGYTLTQITSVLWYDAGYRYDTYERNLVKESILIPHCGRAP